MPFTLKSASFHLGAPAGRRDAHAAETAASSAEFEWEQTRSLGQ